MPNTAPATGAPNTADKAADTPQMTNFLRSSAKKRIERAKADISAAPIWTLGPSNPTTPPGAKVNSVDKILPGTTLKGILAECKWMSSNTFSVPCPSD